MTCGGGLEVLTSTIFMKCGGKTSSGGQERYILMTHVLTLVGISKGTLTLTNPLVSIKFHGDHKTVTKVSLATLSFF